MIPYLDSRLVKDERTNSEGKTAPESTNSNSSLALVYFLNVYKSLFRPWPPIHHAMKSQPALAMTPTDAIIHVGFRLRFLIRTN